MGPHQNDYFSVANTFKRRVTLGTSHTKISGGHLLSPTVTEEEEPTIIRIFITNKFFAQMSEKIRR
jgi:hypothetical protein